MTVLSLDPWRPYHLRLILNATLCARIIGNIADFSDKSAVLKNYSAGIDAIKADVSKNVLKGAKQRIINRIAVVVGDCLDCYEAIIVDADTLLFREEEDFEKTFSDYEKKTVKDLKRGRDSLKQMDKDIRKVKSQIRKHAKEKKGKPDKKEQALESAKKKKTDDLKALEDQEKSLKESHRAFLQKMLGLLNNMTQEQKVMTRDAVANPWKSFREFTIFGDAKLGWNIKRGAIEIKQILEKEKDDKKRPEKIKELLDEYYKELENLDKIAHDTNILFERFESGFNYLVEIVPTRPLRIAHKEFIAKKLRLFDIQRRLATEIKL